jgi:signal transduction histidine kinase
LFASLADYAHRWQEQSGTTVRLAVPECGMAGSLSPLAEVHLSRLVQEALTNVRKHANASEVSITIVDTNRDVRVTIADNGAGFDPREIGRREFPRFGLATMRERAEASGGTFAISSRPGAGTTIEVMLPKVPQPG